MTKDKKIDIIPYPVQNFKTGDAVLINGNLIGIIISYRSYKFVNSTKFLYRIIVDGKDCASRIHRNNIDQIKTEELFHGDYNRLLYDAQQLTVLESFEDTLKKYEPK